MLLKDGMGVKDEKSWYYVDWLEGWSQKKTIYREELPKKGRLGQFADLRGLGKKECNALNVDYYLSPGWVFLPCIIWTTSMTDFSTNKYIHNI